MTSHSEDAPGGNALIILVTGATGNQGGNRRRLRRVQRPAGALSSPPVRFEDEVRRGRNVVDAAAVAGAEHLVGCGTVGLDPGRRDR